MTMYYICVRYKYSYVILISFLNRIFYLYWMLHAFHRIFKQCPFNKAYFEQYMQVHQVLEQPRLLWQPLVVILSRPPGAGLSKSTAKISIGCGIQVVRPALTRGQRVITLEVKVARIVQVRKINDAKFHISIWEWTGNTLQWKTAVAQW